MVPNNERITNVFMYCTIEQETMFIWLQQISESECKENNSEIFTIIERIQYQYYLPVSTLHNTCRVEFTYVQMLLNNSIYDNKDFNMCPHSLGHRFCEIFLLHFHFFTAKSIRIQKDTDLLVTNT